METWAIGGGVYVDVVDVMVVKVVELEAEVDTEVFVVELVDVVDVVVDECEFRNSSTLLYALSETQMFPFESKDKSSGSKEVCDADPKLLVVRLV